MRKPKLSIIIPVYNVGSVRLCKCLDSVELAIVFNPQIDFDVILINDCSPIWDLESVVTEGRDWLRVYSNERNIGLGATRNRGIDLSVGDYIWFVDSDDEIISEHLAELMEPFEYGHDIDAVQMWSKVRDSEGNISDAYFNCENKFTETNVLKGWNVWMTNYIVPPAMMFRIFRKSFLIKNNLRVPEGVYYEDQEFLVRCSAAKMRLFTSKALGYVYAYNPTSIMHATPDYRHVSDRFKFLSRCSRLTKNIFKDSVHLRKLEYLKGWVDYEDELNKLSLWDKLRVEIFSLVYGTYVKLFIKPYHE